jgi:hypothetical protein
MSDANNAWPPPLYATRSVNAIKDAPFRDATAHPATATPTTLIRG